MTTITRQNDGAVLEVSSKTTLFTAEGILDVIKTREYTFSDVGGSVPLSSIIAQKTFDLNFVTLDFTGDDQNRLTRFFGTDDGYYIIDDPLMKISNFHFTVVSIENAIFESEPTVTITCQAKYGDLIQENKTQIYSESFASYDPFPGFSGNFTNNSKYSKSLLLEIELDNSIFWGGFSVTTSKASSYVTAKIGERDPFNNDILYEGKIFGLDSMDEIVTGKGMILPVLDLGSTVKATRFFNFKPRESSSIKIESFEPIFYDDPINYKVTLSAIAITQKETY